MIRDSLIVSWVSLTAFECLHIAKIDESGNASVRVKPYPYLSHIVVKAINAFFEQFWQVGALFP